MNSLFGPDFLLNMILKLPAILIAFTFHEYAHALVADRLGDKTPRFQGRLNLNPITHIDPIGFVAVLLFGFGWAKPVQVNPSAFKNYHKDHLKVSLAGPITNFIIALVGAIVLKLYITFALGVLPGGFDEVLGAMIRQVVILNVLLGFFNLIPVPPLDGFSLFRDLSPKTFYKYEGMFYKYEMLLLLAVMYFGGRIIAIPAGVIIRILFNFVY